MILRRVLKTAAAVAAVSAAVAASVAAAAFALYALLSPALGAAGAAAVVALVFALGAGVGGLLLTRRGGGRPAEPEPGLAERLIDLGRSKPILSVGAAIAAGVLAMRNPALVSVIATALMQKPNNRSR